FHMEFVDYTSCNAASNSLALFGYYVHLSNRLPSSLQRCSTGLRSEGCEGQLEPERPLTSPEIPKKSVTPPPRDLKSVVRAGY
ncbi:9007_t:CDS:2, partial [Entrophospora sp. SA101]